MVGTVDMLLNTAAIMSVSVQLTMSTKMESIDQATKKCEEMNGLRYLNINSQVDHEDCAREHGPHHIQPVGADPPAEIKDQRSVFFSSPWESTKLNGIQPKQMIINHSF